MSRGKRILRRLHHDTQHAHALAKALQRIDARLDPHAAPGDQQRLRHIPAIGRGMGGGAIPGTRPDHNPRILNHRRKLTP